MDDLVCADIRRWLQQAISSKDLAPPPSLRSHIAGCPLCQGALALLSIQALDMSSVTEGIECVRCEEDLAAFIEQEVEEGSAAAIRTYPHIWWHLWACATCAETYRATCALLEAEWGSTPTVISMPANPFGRSTVRQTVMRLERSFLHHALATSFPSPGTVRGFSGMRRVLAEEEYLDKRLTVGVLRQADGAWRVDVVVKPPIVGSLILMLGKTNYRARFDSQGSAIVRDIPSALLIAPDGPDLDIDIELDLEHGTAN